MKYFVDNNLCSEIVVADKSLPVTCSMAPEHQDAFKNVTFMQADLTKDRFVAKIFDGSEYEFVINLCGETRFGLTENDYKTRIEQAVAKCTAAAKALESPPKWIEISTAQIYKSDKKPSTETSAIKPWTNLAVSRLVAEQIVQESGLDHVILRPSIVYGKGDLTGLSPRLVVGVVYKILKEKLEFLWSKSLGLSTVHVTDVCGAIWAACKELPSESIFNLSDESMLTQGGLNEMLAEMFEISAGTIGDVKSRLAQALSLSDIAERCNEKHLPVWTHLCEERKIPHTPLSPYIDKELLYNNSLAVNGSAITKASSFKYTMPNVTTETILDQIVTFEEQGIWPKDLHI